MKQTNDSDLNPAMLASIAFETIIDKIRNSNLNFQLQLSPFSAQISLKKSLVIEKTGVPRLPRAVNHSVFSNSSLDSEISAFATKNMHLESELGNLRAEYDRAVNDCEEAYAKIQRLEAEFQKVSVKKEVSDDKLAEIETLQVEIKRLSKDNIKYREIVKDQKEEINELKNSVKVKTEISNQINKKLSEVRFKAEKDSAAMKKSNQAEVKSWRKELGKERKEKIKLEKKLEKLLSEKNTEDDIRSLVKEEQASPVCEKSDETLKYVKSDLEHTSCQHATQCVTRQPYPPPSPSSPFLFHEVSKYHVHMMNKTADDLIGCIKCFSVDNENYGCDKCTWLKWWFKWHGDRHGFPDIHPSVYKKYQ